MPKGVPNYDLLLQVRFKNKAMYKIYARATRETSKIENLNTSQVGGVVKVQGIGVLLTVTNISTSYAVVIFL